MAGTEADLITPLIATPPPDQPELIITVDDRPGFESFTDHCSSNGAHDDLALPESDNPFEFLGSGGFSVPGSTTIDPFRNHTLEIDGVYEWFKILVCLPVAAIRLVLFGLCLLVGYLATKFALQGWKDKQNPMPAWRRRFMWVTRLCSRCILFSFGYHWIKRKGRPASRENAPIIVSNHVSYIEPIFFFYELFPTIVASESHDSIPFVGTIIRAMQVIYVNRFSPSSRKQAVNEIKNHPLDGSVCMNFCLPINVLSRVSIQRKASCDRYPRVLLFPEGTTTNGRVIISFQLGAFIPGYPIQPVVVRYPHVHFDQSWGHISLGRLMFRMFTQFHNFMEVEYLPVISPFENGKENAVHFAERTSHAIATSLNVVQTSHSYGDLMLLTKACQSKQEKPSSYMVEMARVESSFHLSTLEAVDFLDIFLSMNPDPSGRVKIHDFLRVLRLKQCYFSEKVTLFALILEQIFQFIDVDRREKVTFKQFLFGSVHVMKQPLFRQACEIAFAECDSDGDSYISEQDLGDSIRPVIPDMNEVERREVFDLFDADKDGWISRDDFSNCLRRNPLLIALFSSSFLERASERSRSSGVRMKKIVC